MYSLTFSFPGLQGLAVLLYKDLQLLLGGTYSLWVLVVAVPGPRVLHHLLLTSLNLTLIFVNSPFINLSLINYVNISSVSHQNSDRVKDNYHEKMTLPPTGIGHIG